MSCETQRPHVRPPHWASPADRKLGQSFRSRLKMAILAARGHGTGLAVDPYEPFDCECGHGTCETPSAVCERNLIHSLSELAPVCVFSSSHRRGYAGASLSAHPRHRHDLLRRRRRSLIRVASPPYRAQHPCRSVQARSLGEPRAALAPTALLGWLVLQSHHTPNNHRSHAP